MIVEKHLIDKVESIRTTLNEISVYNLDVKTSLELYYELAKKVNEVITELSRFEGVVSEQVVEQNKKLLYLLGEGLKEQVGIKIDELITNGTIQDLINNKIFSDLNTKIDNFKQEVNEQFNTIDYVGSKLKCDGTDSTDLLQSVLNNVNNKNLKLIFPRNAKFKINKQIVLPNIVEIDFNNSSIITENNINQSAMLINTPCTIKNLKIIQEDNNYSAIQGVNGLDVKSSNVVIENIYTEGFENGIAVKGTDNEQIGIISLKNCKCEKSEMSGILLDNCKKIYVENCISKHNRLDGLKATGNCEYITIIGGSYSYNVDPVDTYADGIDLYNGGNSCSVTGVICSYNGGAGLHILSGEDSIDGHVGNIVVSDCHFISNKGNGFDVINKNSITLVPYVNSVVFSNCISRGNRYGCQISARNVDINNCIMKENQRYGLYLINSVFNNINNCSVLINSIESKGTYSGVFIDSSKFITLSNSVINGYDSKLLTEEIEGEKYHLHGIHVKNTVNCDNLLFDNVEILNCSNERQINVENFTLSENKNKNIIAHLNYVTSTTDKCNFSAGSTIIVNNARYVKNSDLNSTVWNKEVVNKKGVKEFYMANTDTVVIPHSLGYTPTYYNVTPANLKSAEKGNYYVEVDATNIYIKYLTSFTTTLKFSWYVE